MTLISYSGTKIGDQYPIHRQMPRTGKYLTTPETSATASLSLTFVGANWPTANASAYPTDWSETIESPRAVTSYPTRYAATFGVGVFLCVMSLVFGVAHRIWNIGIPASVGLWALVLGLLLAIVSLRLAERWKKREGPFNL